jgi:hypothetical protein
VTRSCSRTGWCDAVLFAHYETANTAVDIEKKGKAVSTGVRKLRTEKSAAVEAKNRYGFPELIALPLESGWTSTIGHYLSAPDRIRADIEVLLASTAAPAEIVPVVRGWLSTVGENAIELQKGLDRLRTRLATPTTTAAVAA